MARLDEDGYANEDDEFDNNPTQWNDADGDGYGDNPNGTNADAFANDSTEWKDSDGDGVGNLMSSDLTVVNGQMVIMTDMETIQMELMATNS